MIPRFSKCGPQQLVVAVNDGTEEEDGKSSCEGKGQTPTVEMTWLTHLVSPSVTGLLKGSEQPGACHPPIVM